MQEEEQGAQDLQVPIAGAEGQPEQEAQDLQDPIAEAEGQPEGEDGPSDNEEEEAKDQIMAANTFALNPAD